VIIERDRIDAAPCEPVRNLDLRVKIISLVPEMKPGIRRKARTQSFHRGQNAASVLRPTQPRLPRPGDTVENGGDAVRDGLAITFDQRDVEGHRNAGTRHDLPLEGVSMNIDDSGKDSETPRIKRAALALFGADLGDNAIHSADVDGGIFQPATEQNAPAYDANIHVTLARRELTL